MADGPAPSIIEGTVKFRDGKKWKSRWCVMRKLSPVADCVHLQLYKDGRERQRGAQTKASLSLRGLVAVESGFTLDKESNTLALLCEDVVPLLAFDTRELLIHWTVKVEQELGGSRSCSAVLLSSPAAAKLSGGPVRLHARRAPTSSGAPPGAPAALALVARRPPAPPALLLLWDLALLRRYGVVEGRLCVEGGSRCGRGEGLFVFAQAPGAALGFEQLLALHQGGLAPPSRPSSVLEKRLSESESWGGGWLPHSATAHCLQGGGDLELRGARRAPSLPRCTSCMTGISSTMHRSCGGAGGVVSGWHNDMSLDKRSDSDRASMYSRSSSSTEGSRWCAGSGAGAGAGAGDACPLVPGKMAAGGAAWARQRHCGAFDNYDVPRAPMPLIQEHPVEVHSGAGADASPSAHYDTPKKILKCLSVEECKCMASGATLVAYKDTADNCSTNSNEANHESAEPHSNYVNITPECISKDKDTCDFNDNMNIDLNTTLEKFENSMQILRSAGFSQEEIDAMEEVADTESSSTVHPSAECCDDHLNYMHMEPLDTSSTKNSDNLSRITHFSEPSRSESSACLSGKRSNSSDIPLSVSTPIFGLRKSKNEVISPSREMVKDKCEGSLVARLRESVRIRRSSSAPSKADKNRDSSSSNDSGVSTGSLRHRCELEPGDSCPRRRHARCRKVHPAVTSAVHPGLYPGSQGVDDRDPLRSISFHFDELAPQPAPETLTRKKHKGGSICFREGGAGDLSGEGGEWAARVSQSLSSAGSDLSDYLESLSVSSMSSASCACACSSSCACTCACACPYEGERRHVLRPRSGNEYSTLDRSLILACAHHRI